MKKLPAYIFCATLAVSLTGCETTSKQNIGVATGGVIGGLVGSAFGKGSGQAVGIVGGALLGALIGGTIGRNMDMQDQANFQAAMENQRTGYASRWTNPDTGNSYTVTPTQTYQYQGMPCREYNMTAMIGGKPQQVYGTACRQPDGSWKIVNN